MRHLVTACVLLFCSTAYGADTIQTQVFKYLLTDFFNTQDKADVLIDLTGELSLEDVLDSSRAQFVDTRLLPPTNPPFYSWSRIRLENQAERILHAYLTFPTYLDSVWVYTLQDGELIEERRTGERLPISEKELMSIYNMVPVQLDPKEGKSFYVRSYYGEESIRAGVPIGAIYLMPAKGEIHNRLTTFFWQSLYGGAMLLFGLLCIFMYAVFRERIFLYFCLVVIALATYFMLSQAVMNFFFDWSSRFSRVYFMTWTIACLIFSLALFISAYLRLRKLLPRANKIYWLITLSYLAVQLLSPLILSNYRAQVQLQNLGVIIWMLSTIGLIIYLVFKGDKPARVMLISISCMFLGALLFVYQLLQGKPSELSPLLGFQLGSLVFTGILFYSLFDKYNVLQSERQRMAELNQVKSKFFANISHEFRTPLTLMLAPLEQVMEGMPPSKDKDLVALAHHNASRQLELINQLLDLSKAESGYLQLQASEADIVPLIKGAVYSFASLADQQKISLAVESQEKELLVWYDREKLEIILYNLLANAIKYSEPNGEVKVKAWIEKQQCLITISDRGKGISPDQLPFVFNRFMRMNEDSPQAPQGYGLGLALTKELVQLHQGEISIESQLGQGTKVLLRLPLGKNHLLPEQMTDSPDTAGNLSKRSIAVATDAILPASVETEALAKMDHRILIIEDHADVRAFIRQRLDDNYQIAEAEDGEVGIRAAHTQVPDLIICDVMMPRKNGYEVCEALKMDVRTSHIPIILLTAKASQAEKLEGLETGADDYLIKPFDAKELEARVRNLLQSRAQLRQRFATSIAIKPSELVTNSLDQQFLEDALQIVEKELMNNKFGIEDFALAIGMSRPNLNRKLRALVNQSTNQFIQSIRLQRAADLLQQQAATVGEIAFQTGFSSTAYFVKCFKEQYGQTPGNFQKETPES